MARVLAMQERVVPVGERVAYLANLAPRRALASAVLAHFWVFEHAAESGRFVEFFEAASEQQLAAAQGLDEATPVWREVHGG